jgi:hypothetical protein
MEEYIMADKTREEKLAEVHAVEKVYPNGKVLEGGNDQIVFDARDEDGKKVPVTTTKHNRMESHFFFDKPENN